MPTFFLSELQRIIEKLNEKTKTVFASIQIEIKRVNNVTISEGYVTVWGKREIPLTMYLQH